MPTAMPKSAAYATVPARTGYAVPVPKKPQPVATPKPRAKRSVHTKWQGLILLAAMLGFAIGMVFLSGHTRVAAEGYRRVKLLNQLKREKARAAQLRELNGTAFTPSFIDSEARRIKLTQTDDKNMVTVGEKN